MKKTAIIVVTFNRKEMLKINLSCIQAQTLSPDCIYVIDNASSDGTYELMINYEKTDARINYVRMNENLGGAGGFSEGIRRAYEDGYDYVWGMDDDAFPKEDALQKIFDAKITYSEDTCFWSNCNKDKEFAEETKIVQDWMFVGFFIPRSVIKEVGYPRSDFFIYYDDREYADRIIKAGHQIIKIKNSIIEHQDTIMREFRSRTIFGVRLRYPLLSDWKNYYYVRNNILRFGVFDIRRYGIIFYWCPMFLIKLLLIYPKQVPNFLKAYLHGIFCISGARMKP